MRCQGVSPQPVRTYSSVRSAVIWRGEGFQHFSDISWFLTFMVKSPQTCLLSNLQCADMQVYELHTYTDLCQCCGLVLNDCKHTPVWNMDYRLQFGNWCTGPSVQPFLFMPFLFYRLIGKLPRDQYVGSDNQRQKSGTYNWIMITNCF